MTFHFPTSEDADRVRSIADCVDNSLKVGVFGAILFFHYGKGRLLGQQLSNKFWARIGQVSKVRLGVLSTFFLPDVIDLGRGSLISGKRNWKERASKGTFAVCDAATLLLFLDTLQIVSLGPYTSMVDRLSLTTWTIGATLQLAQEGDTTSDKKKILGGVVTLLFAGTSLIWPSYGFPVVATGFASGITGLLNSY